jgi:hypothetical protein
MSSLLLTLGIIMIIGNEISFENPLTRLIITIAIPLLDFIRLLISVYIIRNQNLLKISYAFASAISLILGLLYLNLISTTGDALDIFEGGISKWIFISEMFAIGLLQIVWFLPLLKKYRYEYYILAMLGSTALSFIWIIVLVDIPSVFDQIHTTISADNTSASDINRLEEIFFSISLQGRIILLIHIIYILILATVMTSQNIKPIISKKS